MLPRGKGRYQAVTVLAAIREFRQEAIRWASYRSLPSRTTVAGSDATTWAGLPSKSVFRHGTMSTAQPRPRTAWYRRPDHVFSGIVGNDDQIAVGTVVAAGRRSEQIDANRLASLHQPPRDLRNGLFASHLGAPFLSRACHETTVPTAL
jgi:hypothetical protein